MVNFIGIGSFYEHEDETINGELIESHKIRGNLYWNIKFQTLSTHWHFSNTIYEGPTHISW